MISKALIIPAAGSGVRMNQKVPKPFLKVSGQSILEHTLQRFLSLKGLVQIVVATSEDFLGETRQILSDHVAPSIKASAIAGGKERQHSINKALSQLVDADMVIIHDAVRPFVKINHIEACCKAASKTGAAALGVPVKDTIKRVDDECFVRETPSRQLLWQAQTPQVFKRQLILQAYENALKENYIGTDDASLIEQLGERVKMVEGDQLNFKITYPFDLKMAHLLIEDEQKC